MGQTTRLYVGSGDKSTRTSIYIFELNVESGAMRPIGTVSDFPNCLYLNAHPSKPYLYATGGTDAQHIHSYRIADDGTLTLLNKQPTIDTEPCYVSIAQDGGGDTALMVNYNGPQIRGSILSFPVRADGQLQAKASYIQLDGNSKHPARQEASHPHMILPTPDSRFVFVPDLGTDKVMVYQLDQPTGELKPHTTPYIEIEPGSGPRHLALHPNKPYLYIHNELEPTITVIFYDDATDSFRTVGSVPTLTPDIAQECKPIPVNTRTNTVYGPTPNMPEHVELRVMNRGADIHITPDGRFLYGSNRGHNSLVIYAINPETDTLTYVGHQHTQGDWPRSFVLDPTGQIVIAANQWSNDVFSFKVDRETGKLTPTGHSVEVPEPLVVKCVNAH